MKGTFALPLLIFSLFVTSSLCFDYYVLATEWQGSVCKYLKRCHASEIENTVDNQFNIHGLWPSNFQGSDPFSCGSDPLAYNQLGDDLVEQLAKFWSGLYSPSDQFLSHEWSKHGTCWEDDIQANHQQQGIVESFLELHRSRSRRNRHKPSKKPRHPFNPNAKVEPAQLRIQQDWIHQVIKVGSQYSIYTILAKANILPDNDTMYNTNDIREAIENELGVQNFDLGCIRKNNQQYLGEIHVCLDRGYQPIDCPLKRERHGNCAEDQPVGYPTFDRN